MKKVISLVLAFIFLVTFAVGCGTSSNNTSTSSVASADKSTAEVTPTVKAEATPAAPKQVTLKVFLTFPRFKDQVDKYFEQFKEKAKKENNEEVAIKLEMPNSDQAKQILNARLASNDAPDVFALHVNDVPTYNKAGYMEDLSSQPFTSALYSNIKDIVTFDKKVMVLPLESTEWGYLYNKKIFTEVGITPPQTLDEMKEVIKKLKEKKYTPFLLAFQESWVPQLMMALSLGGTVNSSNPDFIENMNSGKGSYKDVQSVFDIIDLIMANGSGKPFEVGSAQGSTDFANGKAAIWVQGPWQAESILKANPDMEIGVAPLPVSNDAKGTMINLAVTTSLAVSSSTKNPETALRLLNYFLDEKDSSALYEELKFNPVANFHKYKTYSWTEEATAYISQGKAYKDLSLPNGVTDETAKLLQSYYAKKVTKEQIIKDLDKTWANALKAQSK